MRPHRSAARGWLGRDTSSRPACDGRSSSQLRTPGPNSAPFAGLKNANVGAQGYDCISGEPDGGDERPFVAAQRPSAEGLRSTPCSRWRLPVERQLCSGSGHSRPQRELTVSATFRSSRRQRDRDADDRSQGSADVARRMCVARWFPERQLNRCRGHWASKTNRMSAGHGAGLTHPTLCCRSGSRKAAVRGLRRTATSPDQLEGRYAGVRRAEDSRRGR